MQPTTLTSRPRADGFFMPAEWAPQQAVWMLWPYRPDNWRADARPGQRAFAAVADAIAGATPVLMGVPEGLTADARRTMPAAVTLVAMESDDAWVRDSGPTIVVNDRGERRGVDWIFNAWGGLKNGLYHPWERDEQVAPSILAHHGFPRYQAPLVVEGGGIHTDGEGTCLLTEEVHLSPGRNPALTRAQIEDYLRDYMNVETFIWLPLGVYMDETDGHIDNLCCFARPGEVILTWTDDENDPQHARSKAALEILAAATDAKGRRLKVHKLLQPGPLHIAAAEASGIAASPAMARAAGQRMAGSYVNFLISNGRIIAPQLDPNTDAQALRELGQIFPRHEVIGVPTREILLGGGNIHCITQQIPSESVSKVGG